MKSFLTGIMCLIFMFSLSSCGGGGGSSSTSSTPSTLTGIVESGATVVSGSKVVLWASGENGGVATPIGITTTNASGDFSLSYTNPGSSYTLYVTADSGDAGAGTNSSIQMATVVGAASSVPSSDSVTINELTTAAFMVSFNSSYTSSGIVDPTADQVTYAANLVDTSSGTMKTTNGNMIEALDFEADVLVACNQTSGASSGACGTLETDSNNASDVALAMLNWSANTAAVNWSGLDSLASSVSATYDNTTYPVSNLITSGDSPSSPSGVFTTGITQPRGLVIDGNCNVWVGSDANPGSLSEIDLGTQSINQYTTGSAYVTAPLNQPLDQPNMLAMSGPDYVAIAEQATNAILTYSISLASFQQMTLFNAPVYDIASGDNASTYNGTWYTNYSSLVTSSQVGYAGSNDITASQDTLIAADPSGEYAWAVDPTSDTITKFTAASGTPSALGSCTLSATPTALAVDSNGTAWAVTSAGSTLYELAVDNTTGSCTETPWGLQGGGNIYSSPTSVAVDGANNVWVTSSGNDQVVEFVNSSSPYFHSYNLAGGSTPVSLAIDPMGDVWVANNGANNVTALPGIATGVGSCTPSGATQAVTGSTATVTSTDFDWTPTTIGTPSSGSSGTMNENNPWYWWGWNLMLN